MMNVLRSLPYYYINETKLGNHGRGQDERIVRTADGKALKVVRGFQEPVARELSAGGDVGVNDVGIDVAAG